jgi:hypothetical protein
MTRFSQRLGGLATLALCAACSCARPSEGPPPSVAKPTRDAVTLKAEKQANGRWKAMAAPEHLKIKGYDAKNPDSEVVWTYTHKSTTIVFADAAIQANVKPCDAGRCTLRLPAGLEYGKPYKYTIKGKLDDTTDLEDNDPDIEVDR